MGTSLATLTGRVVVTADTEVDDPVAHRLWRLYSDCFAGMRTLAASRHLLQRGEFDDHLGDPRVDKLVAWVDEQPVGLVTLTTDLDAVPWISPEFYANRYPAHAQRQSIFYCGLAMVHPFARYTEAFARMVGLRAGDIAAADGVLAADLCRFNVDETELGRMITLLMRRAWGGVDQVELDRQVFLAWEPPARAVARWAGIPAARDSALSSRAIVVPPARVAVA